MKTKSILIALFSFIFIGAMYAKNDKVVFSVEMDCHSCKEKIEKNIPFERGVKGLLVDLEKNLVTVTYKASKTDIAKLQKGFTKIGFTATEVKDQDCCAEKAKTDGKQVCPDEQKPATACETPDCDTKIEKKEKM